MVTYHRIGRKFGVEINLADWWMTKRTAKLKSICVCMHVCVRSVCVCVLEQTAKHKIKSGFLAESAEYKSCQSIQQYGIT